jgi:hypothetical protein
MFDEKVLRYNAVGRHDSEIHDTLNMLVTLYGQRERLAARSIIKYLMTPEEFEAQASKAAAAWLAEVSRPISMAWTLTLVVERLLQLSQGELARLCGQENLRVLSYTPQTQTMTSARLAEMDWWTPRASGVEMAFAMMCALNHTEQSQPLETFLRFATLAHKRLHQQKASQECEEGSNDSHVAEPFWQ